MESTGGDSTPITQNEEIKNQPQLE